MERLWTALTSDYREALKTMTGSGVPFVNLVFRWSVVRLTELAALCGVSYETLNVVVFVVLLPLLLLVSLGMNVHLWRRLPFPRALADSTDVTRRSSDGRDTTTRHSCRRLLWLPCPQTLRDRSSACLEAPGPRPPWR